MNSEPPAWKTLISSPLTANERIALITTIFSDTTQAEMVERLSGDDAQIFTDMVYEVGPCAISRSKGKSVDFDCFVGQELDRLEQETRRRSLRYLRGICGRQTLLPRSLEIPLCYDVTENPLRRGGFADVWKGKHNGQDVAAKVFKLPPGDNRGRIRKVGYRRCSLLVVCTDNGPCFPAVLQGGCGVAGLPSFGCTATVGRDNDGGRTRNGVGVDDEG